MATKPNWEMSACDCPPRVIYGRPSITVGTTNSLLSGTLSLREFASSEYLFPRRR
ncbi:unnamed protein product [Penicillium camemberti]|uniref:Str. FM013 n=1 Tax=Penicillium camemberti (strain FM 013) TaxID=1429867 RepID=A0A0G4PD65_PENC3|nr:unnamed protein product [Penicillium camemberti]